MRFITNHKIYEAKVVLSLDSSRPDGLVYLKANGKAVMGFKEGKYCLYTDAGRVDGLRVDEDGDIIQAVCRF